MNCVSSRESRYRIYEVAEKTKFHIKFTFKTENCSLDIWISIFKDLSIMKIGKWRLKE